MQAEGGQRFDRIPITSGVDAADVLQGSKSVGGNIEGGDGAGGRLINSKGGGGVRNQQAIIVQPCGGGEIFHQIQRDGLRACGNQ